MIGAVVAVKGLSAWKRQLKGQVDFDLARRTLRTLFEYRDAVDAVRHPAMWAHEMPTPPEEQARSLSPEQIRFYGRCKAYENRWVRLNHVRGALNTAVIETEALWGNEIKEVFADALRFETQLWVRIHHQMQLENPEFAREDKKAIQEMVRQGRHGGYDILYDTFSEDDPFRKQFNAAIDKVAEKLKRHLRRYI